MIVHCRAEYNISKLLMKNVMTRDDVTERGDVDRERERT